MCSIILLYITLAVFNGRRIYMPYTPPPVSTLWLSVLLFQCYTTCLTAPSLTFCGQKMYLHFNICLCHKKFMSPDLAILAEFRRTLAQTNTHSFIVPDILSTCYVLFIKNETRGLEKVDHSKERMPLERSRRCHTAPSSFCPSYCVEMYYLWTLRAREKKYNPIHYV